MDGREDWQRRQVEQGALDVGRVSDGQHIWAYGSYHAGRLCCMDWPLRLQHLHPRLLLHRPIHRRSHRSASDFAK